MRYHSCLKRHARCHCHSATFDTLVRSQSIEYRADIKTALRLFRRYPMPVSHNSASKPPLAYSILLRGSQPLLSFQPTPHPPTPITPGYHLTIPSSISKSPPQTKAMKRADLGQPKLRSSSGSSTRICTRGPKRVQTSTIEEGANHLFALHAFRDSRCLPLQQPTSRGKKLFRSYEAEFVSIGLDNLLLRGLVDACVRP